MKRGDPVTNRFIDYCIMQTGNLQILVRDGKTGQTLYAPQGENARWIHRVKSGLGRASKNEFEVLQAVDRKMLLELDRQRKWRFNFDSHYELYIWDFVPGESPMELFHYLVDVSQQPSAENQGQILTDQRCYEGLEGSESTQTCTFTRNISLNN